MVNSCLKCGRGSEQDKDVTLFEVPIANKGEKWQMEFLERLGLQDVPDKNVYICTNHFAPEDFEMKNSVLQLKQNALPLNDEDFTEQMEIRPEVIYFKSESDVIEVGADSMSDTSETKDIVPLEPLVEYINVYEDSDVKTENDLQTTGAGNVIIESEYVTDNGTVVSDNLGLDPVMPFFLTSSPMFTIVNENNEVGETIIVQIEETDDKKPLPVKEDLDELHNVLCKSATGSVSTTYTCDICDGPYGCLNCLKSHYETLHIYNAVRRYKCKFQHHVSRSLVCPVCELTFETRCETMDHYVTHSVACEICGSGFDRHAYLTEHYKTAHNKPDQQSLYECDLCRMSYRYAATLSRHYRTFHKMTLCYACKARFDTVEELQEHEKVHQEKLRVLPFACSKCDKAFPKISDIAVHIRQDHKRETIVSDEECTTQKRIKVKK